MVYTKLLNTKISGISCVIPKNEVLITDNKNLYGGDRNKIERLVNSSGFYKRRITDDRTTTADLCEIAATKLINVLNININDIDALIFSSYTPDYIMPATSYILHKKLGLGENCIAMDIPQACSGYVLGLFQASMLINSGCRKVLLLVGDTFSKFNDMFSETEPDIFGDAGSATLVEYDNTALPMHFNINTYSQNNDALIVKTGGFRDEIKLENFDTNNKCKRNSKMDGRKIFDFAMQNVSRSITNLLEKSGTDINSIQYLILHQANKFIMENIVQQLQYNKDKVPMETLSKYGNQCGASIPCTLCDNLSEILNSNKLKILLCGFGAGLSIANVIIDVEKIYCQSLIEI